MIDREGNKIKEGAVVLGAITANNRHHSDSYSVYICKRNEDNELILDGVYGYEILENCNPVTLQILHKDVSIRKLSREFIKQFGSEPSYDRVYVTYSDFQELLEYLEINYNLEITNPLTCKNNVIEFFNNMREDTTDEQIEELKDKVNEIMDLRDRLNEIGQDILNLSIRRKII